MLFGALVVLSPVAREAQEPPAGHGPEGGFAISAVRDGARVDPGELDLHLVDRGRLTHEVFSTWSAGFAAPAAGGYDLWLDGEAEISADQQPVVSSAGRLRFQESTRPFQMVRAATLALAPDVELSDRLAVRLVTVASRQDQEDPRYGFTRWITAAESTGPVTLPQGTSIALLYDRETREIRAVSSPIEAAGPEASVVSFEPREGDRISVLAFLDAPAGTARPAEAELSLWLETEGGRRAPDVLTTVEGALVGIWYRVEGRVARIEAATKRLFLEPVELSVTGAGVRTVEAILRARPFLDVRIDCPPDLSPEEARVSVARVEGREVVAEATLPPRQLDAAERFEALPPEELLVTARLLGGVNWVMWDTVDLRAAESAELVFRPLRFVLNGRLFHGDEPASGTLRLFTDQQDRDSVVTVEADEKGFYEIPLFSPGRFPIHVSLRGMTGPTFKIWTPYFETDSSLDIHVPLATARVLVRDRHSGKPIEGAEVIYDSKRMRDGVVVEGTSGVEATGADGRAALPPLARGGLTVRATAEGYLTADPVDLVIEDEGTQEVVVELDPIGEGARLSFVLPDGRPAAGAEIRAQRSGWNEPPMWQGRADLEGGVEVPASVAGSWLLVRHPEAGSWIEGWTGEAGTVWTLPARSGRLSIRSLGLDGQAQPWVSLAVRFPRAWVAGAALAWLAGTTIGGSDGEAYWASECLPAADLSVIAGSPDRIRLVLQGLLDGSAERIPQPWPAIPVEVEAIR